MSLTINDDMIENALLNWDFNQALALKEMEVKNNIFYAPIYCKYLLDIGKISDALLFIKSIREDTIGSNLLYTHKDFKICKDLIATDDRLLNEYIDEKNFFAKTYYFSKHLDLGNLKALLLSDEWKENVNADISAEKNMILNFALDSILNHFMVNESMLTRFIDHLFVAKNINETRKRFILFSIINYCKLNPSIANNFFRLKEQYYNHLQKLMSMIHSFSNEEGGKLLMFQLYQQLQKFNNFSLQQSSSSPRVAICISGMNRADLSGLQSIHTHLATPLNADVFMHTWDVQQDWIGGARANDRFWFRTFNVNESKMPKNLLNLTYLKEHFPTIAESLLSASYSTLDRESITSTIKPTSLVVENQDDFLKQYNIGDSYKSRDSLNQIKMFYGMFKVFSALKQHETKNGFKYDYVIRVRPDLVIKKGIDYSDLTALGGADFAAPTGFYGIQDMVFYTSRDIYSQIINIFGHMLDAKKLSPLKHFPKYDAHALFFGWLLHKDIKPVSCKIKYNIEEGLKNLKVPNLKLALEQDINLATKFKCPDESEWLESFLRDRAK